MSEDETMSDNEWSRLFSLNPVGFPEAIRSFVTNWLEQGHADAKGNPIDYNFLYKRYKNHVDYLQPHQKPGFTKRGMEIQPLMDYIQNNTYLIEYGTVMKVRDEYLFGNTPFESLKQQCDAFRTKCRRG